MLKLGRAQGVAMAAGLSRDIPITKYEPKKIKMAITEQMPVKNKLPKCYSNYGTKELPKIWIVLMDLQQQFVIFNSGKVVGTKAIPVGMLLYNRIKIKLDNLKMCQFENEHQIGK
jgi:crossover junction endodeoxyribonuclease RuvC